ncbi:MAG: hypothetical protein ACRD96_04105, partial [Bryobacteraceae bacterium]
MQAAGEKLRRVRESLDLTMRGVEEASRGIADRHQAREFTLGVSRLSDIENRGVLPSVYRLYSLSVIYRVDLNEILDWYGLDVGSIAADSAAVAIGCTHLIRFAPHSRGYARVPLE